MSATSRSLARIVVVGGNIAGLTAVEELRSSGYERSIVLVSEERQLPYHRPPLSKAVLTDGISSEAYHDEQWFDNHDVELHLGTLACHLDIEAQIVLAGKDPIGYDGVIIATGSRPRHPWAGQNPEGVVTLRTAEDARNLRAILEKRPRLVVVGAGFIGSEVASSARALGCEVTILEAAVSPLIRAVGAEAGQLLAGLHQKNGVVLRCNETVKKFGGSRVVEYVETMNGERIPADAVLVGVGVVPNVEWLARSQLSIGNGVVCDEMLCAGPPNVYAAGDVASWNNRRYGQIRPEQWTMASLQGRMAARNLVSEPGEARPFDEVPYFWSDQYGSRIQVLGMPNDGPLVDLGRDSEGPCDKWVVGWQKKGKVTGIMALNWPMRFAKLRSDVNRGSPIDALIAVSQK